MEINDYFSSNKSSTEEEESKLLERLIALKKTLEDNEPKIHQKINNAKENIINNKNVVTLSKFKYRKINNQNVNIKRLSTKIDNRNLTKNQSKVIEKNILYKSNNEFPKVFSKTNSSSLASVQSKTIVNIKNPEVVNSQNTDKYNSEINEIMKNSHVKNCKELLSENFYGTSNISQTLHNIDKYINNVQDYLTSSKYVVVNKEDVSTLSTSTLSTSQSSNHVKNVHVNRNFQNQLISNSLINSNLKSASNQFNKKSNNINSNLKSPSNPFNKKLYSLNKRKSTTKLPEKVIESPNLIKMGNTKLIRQSSKSPSNPFNKKLYSINKRKSTIKLTEKVIESPNLIKIGNTKLIRQSLFRNKWKINNKLNCSGNSIIQRKPLSTLQCPTSDATLCNKTNWIKVTNPTPTIKPKICIPSNVNKLKWTRPNILLNYNMNNSKPLIQPTDKLILFGKNKIIRQSLITSTRSKTKNYLSKHLSHRFALMRKLQQKYSVPKFKNVTINNEQSKNKVLLKTTVNKPVDIQRNGKRSYSTYSYVNPNLRLKTNTSFSLENTELSNNNKTLRLLNTSNNISHQNVKINEKNKQQTLSLIDNNKTLERLKSKRVLTKQLCLLFNRFGVCSKLDQGNCDKRHYKKYITLCTKFLTNECFKDNCTLSHNIVEEKIPFCKHYLNSVCIQLNCPFLHQYRDKNVIICKHFLHGYCTLGKKCPKKHLNLCPIFETKNKCPHGEKCLYPHTLCEEKKTVDVEISEPRYFEVTISNNEESDEKEHIQIVPRRHAPLTDLPSFIPLKKQ